MRRLIMIASAFVLLLVGCQGNEGKRTAVSTQSLIGYTIVNQQEQTIGELAQLIINTDDQQVAYGVIKLAQLPSGFKGAGFERHIPVPWSQLNFDGEKEHLILSSAGEALLAYAPSLQDLDEGMGERWDTAVHTHWQQMNTNSYESTTNR